MTGRPGFNFAAFDTAAFMLRAEGYDVISPAELDDPEVRAKCLASLDGQETSPERGWGACLTRDLAWVLDRVDAVAAIAGWQRSRGARLETFAAYVRGLPVLRAADMRRIPTWRLAIAWVFGR